MEVKMDGVMGYSASLWLSAARRAGRPQPPRPGDIRALPRVQRLQTGKYSSSWGSNKKPVCAKVCECPKPHRYTHCVLVLLESDSWAPFLPHCFWMKHLSLQITISFFLGIMDGCTCSCTHSGRESWGQQFERARERLGTIMPGHGLQECPWGAPCHSSEICASQMSCTTYNPSTRAEAGKESSV